VSRRHYLGAVDVVVVEGAHSFVVAVGMVEWRVKSCCRRHPSEVANTVGLAVVGTAAVSAVVLAGRSAVGDYLAALEPCYSTLPLPWCVSV
jgi:hypothetical protein